MKLAIIGSRSLAGHPDAQRLIEQIIDRYIERYPNDLTIVSGGAAGIDQMAAQAARRRGVCVIEHRPRGRSWPAFRARNLAIAQTCHELVRIADPRSATYGSGWTRDRARELGRPTAEYFIPPSTIPSLGFTHDPCPPSQQEPAP
jgi:hypothetical protein